MAFSIFGIAATIQDGKSAEIKHVLRKCYLRAVQALSAIY
jgi:hypothetical protein